MKPDTLKKLQQYNPEYWEAYYIVGKYYMQRKYYSAALNAFQKAKTKEITTVQEQQEVDSYIKKLKRKLKK